MNLQINTYWNVQTLYYILNGVAAFTGSGTFSGLVKFTMICGLLIAIFATIGRKGTEIFKWFMSAMVVFELLCAPVANVFITDIANIQPTMEVDNVPVYLAAIAQASTTTFSAITKAYETAFGLPDTLGLEKGDVGFGNSILRKVNQAQVTDPGLQADLMQFFKECTVYDIQDGVISPSTIMTGTDVWNTVLTSTSPSRYVTTNTLTASPTTDTCQAVGVTLLLRVQDAEQQAEQMYGREMYPAITDPSLAQAAFVNAIGDSYGFILQASQSASTALRQAMFNNIWQQAGSQLPAMLSDPSQVQEVNALIGSAQAATAANGSLMSTAILAQETMPTVRNYFEAILYAVFPIVLVMCLLAGGEAAKRILAGYAKALAWIGLWPVIFAVINHMSLLHMRAKTASMGLSAGVPFGMSSQFGSTLIDEQALLGYLIVVAPAFAWGLLNLATTGFSGILSHVMAPITGAAQTIGGQVAQGDENIGNVHMDSSSIATRSENVTTRNKSDVAPSLKWGSAAIDAGTGSVFTNFDSGGIVRSDYQNSLGFGMTGQSANESILGSEASRGISASASSSKFAGSEMGAQNVFTIGHSNDRDDFERLNDESSEGTRGSLTQGGERRQLSDQSYVDEQGHLKGQQTTWGYELGANAGIGADIGLGGQLGNQAMTRPGGAGGGAPAYSQAEENKLTQKAQGLGKSSQEVEAVRDAYRVATGFGAAGGGAGAGGRAKVGAELGASVRGNFDQQWRRDNTDAQRFVNQYLMQEGYTDSAQFSRDGAFNHVGAAGQDANQRDRMDVAATLTNGSTSGTRQSADLNRSSDFRQRGATQTITRIEESRNLLTPDNLRAVAARNGMSYSQFMSLSEPDMRRMVQDDALTRSMVRSATTLPHTAPDGSVLPTRAADVIHQNRTDQAHVSRDVGSTFDGFAHGTGYTDSSPLNVQPAEPKVVADAKTQATSAGQRVPKDSSTTVQRVRDNVDVPEEIKPSMKASGTPAPQPAAPRQRGPENLQSPTMRGAVEALHEGQLEPIDVPHDTAPTASEARRPAGNPTTVSSQQPAPAQSGRQGNE
ncbi:conjugal transfer protein TraG N-terminal domain-containing protein (plasmid) [Burkholderia thailandensis]|uniref:conjugal transfer protein TraG N-terminal domain-containing protein n=1 Tax=Burkholderia thailandensis TaxID=57975 RepID=UPI00192D2B5F|nr:conjugal transfer protein TraG N-terminal domain-containing protein [Burkholderia thailandensis]MBS2132329.1 conjugal transfer protein TraG N-terminal domain-containing protein [Burkholderia thailandensis]QRA15136.1 conjugal transfer protein TraG N-terminal domain-containing protein [Burkholderia thailandensis]